MIIHADGRNEPGGPCTWAFVVALDSGRRIHAASGAAPCREGEGTSLLAEWAAVVHALRWMRDASPSEPIRLRIDSALVAKALKDRTVDVRGAEGLLAEEARQHIRVLKGWRAPVVVERVPRWKNFEADTLAAERAAAAAAAAAALAPEPPLEEAVTPGVPPPGWRTYEHRDAKGRVRRKARSGGGGDLA